jgi:hypothetical protein
VFKTAVSRKTEVYVYIERGDNALDLSSYSPNGLWDLLDTAAENLGEDKDDSGITITKIQFKVRHWCCFVLPCIDLSSLVGI